MKLKGSISSKSLSAEMNAIPSYLQITIDQEFNTESGNAIANRAVALFAEEVRQEIADLKYEPIKITSFKVYESASKSSVIEIGSTVTAYTLEWSTNKIPTMLVLDGVTIGNNAIKIERKDVNVTETTKCTLTATDERGATVTATASLTFLNGVYYGVVEDEVITDDYSVDSSVILTLTRKLQSNRTITFTADAGATQRLAFAIPSRYGNPTINIGGFDYEWNSKACGFVNASGYSESYRLYYSDQLGLGSTTVKVT